MQSTTIMQSDIRTPPAHARRSDGATRRPLGFVILGFGIFLGFGILGFGIFPSPALRASAPAAASPATFDNPVTTTRGHADPWVMQHTDGYYYGTCTGGSSISIWRSKDLLELFRGKPKTIWRAPKSGWNTRDIWAPEIHYLDGAFYIYYAATNASSPSQDRRMGVLKCSGPDPFNDPWTDLGKLTMPDGDTWAIDGTVLQQNGKRYFIWSGQPPTGKKMQALYIMPMSSPVKLTGKRLEISRPAYDWEHEANHYINEGPEILKHGNKTFVIYSACLFATRYYKLGMLVCDSDADPMDVKSWKKSKIPLFKEGNGLYGPGHCSFATDAAGHDWIIYHARLGPGNNDGERHACLQPFTWTDAGFPNFGAPRKTAIPVPAAAP